MHDMDDGEWTEVERAGGFRQLASILLGWLAIVAVACLWLSATPPAPPQPIGKVVDGMAVPLPASHER